MLIGDPILPERFWSKVEIEGECWLWTGAITSAGYGSFWWDGKVRYPHRITFALAGGTLAPGEEIDHLCHIRRCCAPDCLRAASRAVNQRNRAGAQANGSSGARGVTWHGQRGRWAAQAHAYGKHYSGGLYNTIEEASAAAEALRARVYEQHPLDRMRSGQTPPT